ncbi:hypothetical protein N24_1203 [Corynebacterium suranareeae]|uniref:TIGR02206 family membrane protein n=1 Tax=Corynebacterium suranareeae TaxID=2506452 RepID=A0A160PPW5_9CORY|nr:TIGR02206 family membrane protein [Corynebacterium suranareeae]BAU95465.1 hypothetical protein N24_1203 [Corynebacterium suranareeae]
MEYTAALGAMPQYEIEHISMLITAAVLSLIAVPLVRRFNFAPFLGWLLLVLTTAWTFWGFLPAYYTVEQSWPFHFSDLLRVITAIALITRAQWATSVTILWGTTTNLMSLLTPDVQYMQVPWLEFTMYWFMHITVFLAAIILLFGFGEKPGIFGVVISVAWAISWGILCLIVNAFLGTNYGYLSTEPESASILDLLGGWPFYIVAEVLILCAVWVLWSYLINKLPIAYRPKTRNPAA